MTPCNRFTSRLFPFLLVAIVTYTLLAPRVHGQLPGDALRERALAHLCRVWGFAKYYHPALQDCKVNWDVALLRTVPLVEAAADDDAVRAELLALLDLAGDVPDPGTAPPVFGEEQRRLFDLGWIEDAYYDGALGDRLKLIRDRTRGKPHCLVDPSPGSGVPVFDNDNRYYDPMDPYPPMEYRLLAFCRYWNAIRYFSPYRDLMDRDWQAVLFDRVAQWTYAPDGLSFHKVALRTSADLCDAHGVVSSGYAWMFLGLGTMPFTALQLGNDVAVDHSIDPNVRPGDVIRAIGGVALPTLLDSLAPYSFNTNPASFAWSRIENACRGPLGETTVTLEDVSGTRTETVVRSRDHFSIRTRKSHLAIIDTTTPDGKRYGYIDMDQLLPEQVAAVMTQFRETDAIIFDIRGYPAGSIFELSKYILPVSRPIARFSIPSTHYAGMLDWVNTYAGGNGSWWYRGKLIVLINEKAISHAEYTCMFFKAATNSIFIGSATRGSDGNVTGIQLPGGITMQFTGLGVYYPDGTPTQRIGIQPDIFVRPTIDGLRAGRDEVFEAAFDPLLLGVETPSNPSPLELQLYPNSGRSDPICRLTTTAETPVRIDVHDALGRNIHTQSLLSQGTSTVRIPLTGRPRGLYFIRAMMLSQSPSPPVTQRFLRY